MTAVINRNISLTLSIIACLFSLIYFTACGDGTNAVARPTNLPLNPEDGNHFDSTTDPFYEGWYHKVTIPEKGEAFFFVYGIINPKVGSPYPSEAFVYCGRSKTMKTIYQSFPVDSYRAAENVRDVRIGPSARATALRIAGDINEDRSSCSWDIRFSDVVPWTRTMGWMTGSTGFETNWTVGAISSRASGWVRFDGEYISITNSSAYGDHNWGSSFPDKWIWVQANNFRDPHISLTVSGGTLSSDENPLEAYMLGLLLNGELITFRSQDLAVFDVESEIGFWKITSTTLSRRITVTASCDPATLFHLIVPTQGGMKPRCWESLEGTVAVLLEKRSGTGTEWHESFQGTSTHGGVELGE